MEEESRNIEFTDEQEEHRPKGNGKFMRGVIDGTLLTRKSVTKQWPYIFFLVVLSLIYISNRYHADILRERIDELRIETGELRSKAIFVSSELMKLSRQTEVADELEKEGLDLKESMEPPKKLVIKNKSK